MSHLSPGTALAIMVVLAIVAALAVGVAILLTLAHVNRRLRQEIPDSPLRESLLRWNFWTLSFASIGALLRVALSSKDSLTDAQLQIRKGVRLLVGVPLVFVLAFVGVSVAIGAAPSESTQSLISICSLILPLPGLLLLARNPEIQRDYPQLVTAARMSATTLVGSMGSWMLAILLLTKLPGAAALSGLVFLASGVYFGFRYFSQYSQVVLTAAIEMAPEHSEHTRPGAVATVIGIGYFVAVMLVSMLAPQPASEPWPADVSPTQSGMTVSS